MTYWETNLWKESSSCLLLTAWGLFRNFHMVKTYMKFQKYCFLQSEHSPLMMHFHTAQGSGILWILKQAHSCLETKLNQPNKPTNKKPLQQQQNRHVLQRRQILCPCFICCKNWGEKPRSCKRSWLMSPTAVCNPRIANCSSTLAN